MRTLGASRLADAPSICSPARQVRKGRAMGGTHLRSLAAAALLVAACSSDDTANTDSNSASESATGSATNPTASTTNSSASATNSTSAGSGSDSATGTSDGTGSTSDASASASASASATETGSGSTAASASDTNPSTSTSGTTGEPAVCGDGVVEGAEECDDGNDVDTDDCLSTCVAASCGDGFVWDGVEECDDADNIDKNLCSNACTKVLCKDQDKGDMGNVLSYIWIANSSQGTVSKINTKTAIEEARYRVAGGSPSRTSVNLQGDVAVSSRDPGAVTKIRGNKEKCVDKNNNGVIDTSSGPNDIKNFGEDECVLWSKTIGSPGYTAGPRATAWDGGVIDEWTCEVIEDPRLWFGWRDGSGTAHIERLDSDGNQIKEVTYPGWGTGYAPYGGAVNAAGDFFFVGLGDLPSLKIDAQTYAVTNLGNAPGSCKYGMTLDYKGDLWAGGSCNQAVYHWNHENNQWTTLAGSGGSWVLGVMADGNGNVWGAGSNPCRLVHLDIESKTYVANNIPLPGCSQPWGVSIDFEGNVWVVDKANQAFKVHPETYEILAVVTGLVGPYTYSDMTGIALNLQINPQ
ncbi:MAG: hypothetical protein H6710_01080 [Myxococcales bacterium]|nr:hypothetical protein [Myxococcales bacterium]